MTLRHFRSRNFCRGLLAAAACTLALGVYADDIDIFTGSSTPAKPNVLIILDSSSNWSATLGANSCNANTTKFGAEVCALQSVAAGLNSNIRLGLMMFAETGANGAYV